MTPSIDYQGHPIHYYEVGSGEPIVLLHGWPTNAKLWQAQVDFLQRQYRVITFDWLGFGQSAKPLEHQYTFSKMKEQLELLMARFFPSGEQVNIVAHDIGGPAAILWAAENQARVKRLILLNTVIYPFSTSLDKISHTLFRVPLLREIIVSDFGLNILMRTLAKSEDREIGKRIQAILNHHQNTTSRVKLKAILEPLHEGKQKEFLTLSDQFQALSMERHLIIAKKDPLCYRHIKKLSDNNPHLPVHAIENCGHFIPIDRPEALNKILSQILQE